MVKLSRLTIQHFRNVRPGTQLRFRQGRHLLLGLNGSGRTTLLNLVSAAVSMDFSPFKDEPLDIRFQVDADGDEIDAHVVARRRDLVASGQDPFERTLEMKVRSAATDAAGTLHLAVQDTEMTLTRGETTLYSGPAAFEFTKRPGMAALLELVRQLAAGTGLDQARTLQSAARLARARRFDEGLGYLHQITSENGEIYLLPRQPGAPSSGVSFVTPDPLVQEICARLDAGASLPLRIPLSVFGTMGEVLPALGAQAGEVLVERLAGPPEAGPRLGPTRFLLTMAGGAIVPHEQLSFGQQRLLAFHAYLAGSPYVVLVDELSNGLDRRWIDLCLTALQRRQAFLSSTGTELLDHMTFESAEDVRRTLVLCTVQRGAGPDELVWDAPAEKEANALYRAFKSGGRELVQLLAQKGLC